MECAACHDNPVKIDVGFRDKTLGPFVSRPAVTGKSLHTCVSRTISVQKSYGPNTDERKIRVAHRHQNKSCIDRSSLVDIISYDTVVCYGGIYKRVKLKHTLFFFFRNIEKYYDKQRVNDVLHCD